MFDESNFWVVEILNSCIKGCGVTFILCRRIGSKPNRSEKVSQRRNQCISLGEVQQVESKVWWMIKNDVQCRNQCISLGGVQQVEGKEWWMIKNDVQDTIW